VSLLWLSRSGRIAPSVISTDRLPPPGSYVSSTPPQIQSWWIGIFYQTVWTGFLSLTVQSPLM